jgi:hypothetical protein
VLRIRHLGWLDSRDCQGWTQCTRFLNACIAAFTAHVRRACQFVGWLHASCRGREPFAAGGTTGPVMAASGMTPPAGVKKEMQMDYFKTAIAVMAADDTYFGPRDADGRRRVLTAEELDALADFGWHLPDLKGAVATCAHAVWLRVRPRASNRIEPTRLPAAAATSRG